MRPRHNQGMIAAVLFVLALAITSRAQINRDLVAACRY